MPHWLYHLIAWSWGGDGQGGANSVGYLMMSGLIASLPGWVALPVWLWGRQCEEDGCHRLARREDRRKHKVCGKHYRLGLPKPAWDAIAEVRAACERWQAGGG